MSLPADIIQSSERVLTMATGMRASLDGLLRLLPEGQEQDECRAVRMELCSMIAETQKLRCSVMAANATGQVASVNVAARELELHPVNHARDYRSLAANDHTLDRD